MKHVIIGTAGHIDHGKSALTRALVGDREGSRGIDRLKEEQKRGITIELGFAECILPNGQSASIVDVPGHEKLIKHMLMGAGGMDLVLLVVAADEGFMPQTKEHLEILGLLGLKHGIVVLTKTDLVDAEWIEVVKEDLTEHLKSNKKDHNTQRALLRLVGKRRQLLDYLQKVDIERYRKIVKELGLRR